MWVGRLSIGRDYMYMFDGEFFIGVNFYFFSSKDCYNLRLFSLAPYFFDEDEPVHHRYRWEFGRVGDRAQVGFDVFAIDACAADGFAFEGAYG